MSVSGFALFQSAAKKNTTRIVCGTALHQYQFWEMPEVTTMPERASGVSAAKVVATMDVPRSHHVVPPPDLKYSSADFLPRLIHIIPRTSERTRYPAIMSQSASESIDYPSLIKSNALSAIQILSEGIFRQQQNETG